MKKVLLLAACALSVLSAGCSSLPEGAKPLRVNIESVDLANKNGQHGFNILYTVQHDSLTEMPVKAVAVNVKVNGRDAAVFRSKKELKIPARTEKTYSIFVPANRMHNVSKSSLKTPMLQLQAKTQIKILVVDENDSSSRYNATDTYEGLIHESN